MRATKQVLSGLVGKYVKIQKGDLAYEGILTGEVNHRIEGTKETIKLWLMLRADEFANPSEVRFPADDGWTVTAL